MPGALFRSVVLVSLFWFRLRFALSRVFLRQIVSHLDLKWLRFTDIMREARSRRGRLDRQHRNLFQVRSCSVVTRSSSFVSLTSLVVPLPCMDVTGRRRGYQGRVQGNGYQRLPPADHHLWTHQTALGSCRPVLPLPVWDVARGASKARMLRGVQVSTFDTLSHVVPRVLAITHAVATGSSRSR